MSVPGPQHRWNGQSAPRVGRPKGATGKRGVFFRKAVDAFLHKRRLDHLLEQAWDAGEYAAVLGFIGRFVPSELKLSEGTPGAGGVAIVVVSGVEAGPNAITIDAEQVLHRPVALINGAPVDTGIE